MMHDNRAFVVYDAPSAPWLAHALTQRTWTTCQGFRYGGVVFLNDSTSADGAQEYAIYDERARLQIESITFGWCDEAKALDYVQRLAWGTLRSPYSAVQILPKLEIPGRHFCARCA